MIIEMSWNQYHDLATKVAETLKGRQFDQIVGISRSGLILAVHLSHILNIRTVGCVEVIRTSDDEINAEKVDPTIGYWANIDNSNGRRLLLVDDIVGEGKTMELVKRKCGEHGAVVQSAVLVVNLDNLKRDLSELVDVYGELVRGWVVFPWCG